MIKISKILITTQPTDITQALNLGTNVSRGKYKTSLIQNCQVILGLTMHALDSYLKFHILTELISCIHHYAVSNKVTCYLRFSCLGDGKRKAPQIHNSAVLETCWSGLLRLCTYISPYNVKSMAVFHIS